MYKKLIDPKDYDINKLLEDGYSLHSVTPIIKYVSQISKEYQYNMIYHFVKVV